MTLSYTQHTKSNAMLRQRSTLYHLNRTNTNIFKMILEQYRSIVALSRRESHETFCMVKLVAVVQFVPALLLFGVTCRLWNAQFCWSICIYYFMLVSTFTNTHTKPLAMIGILRPTASFVHSTAPQSAHFTLRFVRYEVCFLFLFLFGDAIRCLSYACHCTQFGRISNRCRSSSPIEN